MERYQNEPEFRAHARAKVLETGARRRQQRRDVVATYKADHPCVDCGESDPVVLEFDHVRGTKLMNINDFVAGRGTLAQLAEEIEKCEVRCANCHRRITHKRRIEQENS